MEKNRRNFIKKTALASGGIVLGANAMTASSYRKIVGANDRVRVGIAGFSNRFKGALLPAFNSLSKAQNFELVGVSDIWNRRRDEGMAKVKEVTGNKITSWRNNEEMYDKNEIDAVIISTADFQHALHTVQAAKAKKDVYCEKPFAETMADARVGMKAVKDAGIVFQIGSQRRSGANYHAANDFIKSGKFGDIVMVEMTWNVNQPGRWRLPKLTSEIRESDTDWKRYQMNRPAAEWDPRKYLEYRLFWPYSSGIPGQWMSHQIDTVHWFSGLKHPRSVAANGGIYLWKDGRKNFDTMSAVFDYGPADDMSSGFQVLDTNKVSDNGGLNERFASAMNMKPNKLKGFDLAANAPKVVTSANTGADNMTTTHMLNWMECVRSRETTNGPVEAGYNHSIANIMTTAALRTGLKATFDEATQDVLAGGKVFQY